MPARPSRIALALVLAALAALVALAASSCSGADELRTLKREQLFTLGFGTMEDQLNLFSLSGNAPPLPSSMAMRDGIFFIANGNAGKVISLSSFGDLLSMVYNPDRNPAPVILKLAQAGEPAQGRVARTYPFNAPGAIAVDSRRSFFVEERVPEERRSYDEAAQASLEYVVLRFSRDGEYQDYLGQEGLGGTPFPLIASILITPSDGCVVVCVTGEGWTAFWFSAEGLLESTVRISRDRLPLPEGEADLFPSLDGIGLSPDGDGLLLKIDYYRDVIDQATRSRTGVEFASSRAWILSRSRGGFEDDFELPGFEPPQAKRGAPKPVPRSWDFLGVTLGKVFMSAVDDEGSTYFGVFDPASKVLSRFSLVIEPDELMYRTLHLSPDGIVSAILATRFEARVVWWRFDRVIGGRAP